MPKTLKLKKPPKPTVQAKGYLTTKPHSPDKKLKKQVTIANLTAQQTQFKQVLSQVKLLDTSKSCRHMQALKECKPKRFKLLGNSSS